MISCGSVAGLISTSIPPGLREYAVNPLLQVRERNNLDRFSQRRDVADALEGYGLERRVDYEIHLMIV